MYHKIIHLPSLHNTVSWMAAHSRLNSKLMTSSQADAWLQDWECMEGQWGAATLSYEKIY